MGEHSEFKNHREILKHLQERNVKELMKMGVVNMTKEGMCFDKKAIVKRGIESIVMILEYVLPEELGDIPTNFKLIMEENNVQHHKKPCPFGGPHRSKECKKDSL